MCARRMCRVTDFCLCHTVQRKSSEERAAASAEDAAQRSKDAAASAEMAAQRDARAAARLEHAEAALASATMDLILCAPQALLRQPPLFAEHADPM